MRRTSHIIGAAGFEPATLCSQSRCASQAALRPAPQGMPRCVVTPLRYSFILFYLTPADPEC
jgi:hypothetical protein